MNELLAGIMIKELKFVTFDETELTCSYTEIFSILSFVQFIVVIIIIIYFILLLKWIQVILMISTITSKIYAFITRDDYN